MLCTSSLLKSLDQSNLCEQNLSFFSFQFHALNDTLLTLLWQVPDTDVMENAQPVTLTAGTHSKKRKRKLQEDSALSCSVKSQPMASSPVSDSEK